MYLLSIFPFLQGSNELHIVFILDIVLLCLIFYKVYKNKKLILTKDIKFILILIWSVSYLITTFYSEDHIYEFCKDCANTVWCVFSTYEDDSIELSSIHHNQNSALTWIQQNKEIFEAVNP